MEHLDPLVDSLIDLCRREGGHEVVAEKIHVGAHGLWQIIHRTPLPSGNARGVSTAMRRKLGAHYPDWLSRTQAHDPQSLPDEINKLLQLYFSLPPEVRGEATYTAMQAMISYLPRHSTAAQSADAPAETPAGARP